MNEEGNIDLYTVDVLSGSLQRVTDHPETDTEPDWSRDGNRIAFISDRMGLPQVYLASGQGQGARRLTWEPDAYEGSPCWSPDGKRIAFVRRGFDGFDVYVAEVAGGEPTRLTAGGSNENPSWSPDGLQLVFCRTLGARNDICIINWDGTNPRTLTSDGASIMPTWSPFPAPRAATPTGAGSFR
jgi:TolB protein